MGALNQSLKGVSRNVLKQWPIYPNIVLRMSLWISRIKQTIQYSRSSLWQRMLFHPQPCQYFVNSCFRLGFALNVARTRLTRPQGKWFGSDTWRRCIEWCCQYHPNQRTSLCHASGSTSRNSAIHRLPVLSSENEKKTTVTHTDSTATEYISYVPWSFNQHFSLMMIQ